MCSSDLFSDTLLLYLRGHSDGWLLKFAVPKDAKFNLEVSVTPLLGGVISTRGSTIFAHSAKQAKLRPLLNLASNLDKSVLRRHMRLVSTGHSS